MKKNNPISRFIKKLFGKGNTVPIKPEVETMSKKEKTRALKRYKRNMRCGLDLKHVNGQQRISARYFRTLRRNARRKVERDLFTGKLT